MYTVDQQSADAQDLLTLSDDGGEIRRLTMLFADLVGSTSLSTQVEPETYRTIVGCYRDLVISVVDDFEGQIGSTKGDGLLAVFGHPVAHEDDARRAVAAGLQITREVARLSEQSMRRFGIAVAVRVGVHRGEVYVDTVENDVYGSASPLAARVGSLAEPGTVLISDSVAMLVGAGFELQARPADSVTAGPDSIGCHRVLAERVEAPRFGLGPLVGRDRERAWLTASWGKAQTGELATPGVVFRGEAGIGKSRLAAEAVELAVQSGAPVLELVRPSRGSGRQPAPALVVGRCGICRHTDEDEQLRRLEAELGDLGDAGSELVAQTVTKYLRACLGDGSGVLIAENAHQFDSSALKVLGSLMTEADGRLLVVVTGRHGDWLESAWPAEVFDLAPLTDDDADELIVALEPAASAGQRAMIRRRCDGVPLYIEHVVADGYPSGNDERPDFTGRVAVPDGLYEQLFARLRVSPVILPVVRAAAVLGRHVDRDLLRAVVDLGEREFANAIAELEDGEVLESWGAGGWRFRHELVCEVAAELVPTSVRRELHARVADALFRSAGDADDWWLVAAHYEEAERFDSAASAYRRAETARVHRKVLIEVVDYPTPQLRSA